MHPVQTQSLPTWPPSHSVTCKPIAYDDEDPQCLSGEETDCDSDRGGDTLSREDLQLMASFINLQRARKQVACPVARPAETRTSPVSIPSQTRKYVTKSTNRWLWDDNDEENKEYDECACCNDQSVQQRSAAFLIDQPAAETRNVSTSELIFDFEL